MALNFTGRQPAPEAPKGAFALGRAPLMVFGCFGVAALLAGAVLVVALRKHAAEASPPLPALIGVDAAAQAPSHADPRPLHQAAPQTAPAPAVSAPRASEPAWIMHKGSPTPPVIQTQAVPTPQSPAQPSPEAQAAAAKAKMLAALRQVPHGVITLSIEDDPVAKGYGERLKSLFREAGWTVEETSVFGSGPPRRGLAAAFGVSPADEAVREAFDAVAFQFLPPPRDSISHTPEIFVGAP